MSNQTETKQMKNALRHNGATAPQRPKKKEEEEEEDTSTYTVRVEKAVYDKDGELDWIRTTNEYEFDTYEEALEEYNAYIIEPIGEMLYLDEKDEDGDQENIESRGKYKHEEEE